MSDKEETIPPQKKQKSNNIEISTDDIQNLMEKVPKEEEIEEEPDEEVEENEKMRENIVKEIEIDDEKKYGVINTNTTQPPKAENKTSEKPKKKQKSQQSQTTSNTEINKIQEEKDYINELNKIKSEVLKEEGASAKDIDESIVNSRRKEQFEREEEEIIEVKVKIGNQVQKYKVKPFVDKVFAFLCQGYDNALKKTCYRYIKNVTFAQVSNFQEFIEKYACVCGDKENHIITITPYLEELETKSLVTPKEYDPKFLAFYQKTRFKLGEVVDAVQVKLQPKEDPNKTVEP